MCVVFDLLFFLLLYLVRMALAVVGVHDYRVRVSSEDVLLNSKYLIYCRNSL